MRAAVPGPDLSRFGLFKTSAGARRYGRTRWVGGPRGYTVVRVPDRPGYWRAVPK